MASKQRAEIGGGFLAGAIIILIIMAMIDFNELKFSSETNIITLTFVALILSIISSILLFLGRFLGESFTPLRSFGAILLVVSAGAVSAFIFVKNLGGDVNPWSLGIVILAILAVVVLAAAGAFLICQTAFKKHEELEEFFDEEF